MSNEMAELMYVIALHVAHKRNWALQDAVEWVSIRMEEARAEYQAAHSPLGTREADFIAWLQPPYRPLAA
jgi:hypothetical protein